MSIGGQKEEQNTSTVLLEGRSAEKDDARLLSGTVVPVPVPSVADPHFGVDPDLNQRLHASDSCIRLLLFFLIDVQDANKNLLFLKKSSAY